MRRILRIFFIFTALFFTLFLAEQTHTQSVVSAVNYIQNDYQKVVMVSNSTRNGEIATSEENSDSNSLSNSTATEISFINNNGKISKVQNFGLSIHNLSTNLKNEISVRAP